MKDEDKSKEQLILELKKLREKSKNSEVNLIARIEKYKGLVTKLPVLVDTFSSNDGELTFVNDAYCEYFNKTRAELLGTSFLDLLPEEHRAITWASIKTLNKDNPIVSNEHLVLTPKGKRWHRWTNKVLFDENNIISGYHAFGEDITNQKQYEEALKINEERFRSIIEATTSITWSTDKTGKFVIPQHSWEKFTGQPWEEHKGTGWTKKIHPDDLHHVLEGWNLAVQEFTIYETSGRIWNAKYEGWRDFEVKAIPIIDPDGSIKEWTGIITDTTKNKRLEEQLRQSQKLESLGTLAGGIAHQFNNLLTPILGYSEILAATLDQDSDERHYSDQIRISGKRASELIRQIMFFSKMDPVSFKTVDLAQTVQMVLNLFKITTPANIEIRQQLQEDCEPIKADVTQMHQTIFNLCNNAIQAMEESGGTLEVTLEQLKQFPPELNMSNQKCLCLTIKDTGPGISLKDRDHIFDPFFTTKEVGKGTGLGLSVVYGLVEKHQGKITVESTVGEGTTFSLFFRIQKPTTIKEKVGNEVFLAKNKKSESDRPVQRILLVEDEPDITELYREYLEKRGYAISVCINGKEALNLFKANPSKYDLVFTDQAMTLMTGKQLSKKLLKIKADIPIILTTGYSNVITEKEAKDIGIRYYLEKPVELEKLDQVIQECLESSV